jgi:hypothetical protein
VRFLVALVGLLAASGALADGGPWYIAPGQNSVKVGPYCVPELVGEQYAEIAFNTSSLTVTILAQGISAHTLFTYTGGDIDDGPGTFAWGNPTTGAIEIDDITTAGALAPCFVISIRDDVIDTSGAETFAIGVTDGGSALMDTTEKIIVLSGSTELRADIGAELDERALDKVASEAATGTDVADNSIIAKLMSKSATADFDTFDNTTDSFEAQRDNVGTNGTALTAAPFNWADDINDLLYLTDDLTADSGSTTTIVDAALTQADDDYWLGAAVKITSGAAVSEVRCITDFSASNDRLTVSPAFTQSITTQTYRLFGEPSCGSVDQTTPTSIRSSVGLTTANLDTQLGNALTAIGALNNLSAAQVRDLVIEDQGGGVSLGCALAVVLAYTSGDLATVVATSTFEDPSGTETRTTGTVASSGNRAASINCPTY